ncbi:MAG TPA: extracellular solute-binding protein, partial [Rariglobus sp.]
MRFLRIALLSLVTFAAPAAPAARAARATELTVAAAADLKFALADLLEGFRQNHPDITVKVAYGSSGSFHAQIKNGAPYDLYFSADIAYP